MENQIANLDIRVEAPQAFLSMFVAIAQELNMLRAAKGGGGVVHENNGALEQAGLFLSIWMYHPVQRDKNLLQDASYHQSAMSLEGCVCQIPV